MNYHQWQDIVTRHILYNSYNSIVTIGVNPPGDTSLPIFWLGGSQWEYPPILLYLKFSTSEFTKICHFENTKHKIFSEGHSPSPEIFFDASSPQIWTRVDTTDCYYVTSAAHPVSTIAQVNTNKLLSRKMFIDVFLSFIFNSRWKHQMALQMTMIWPYWKWSRSAAHC